MARSNGVQLPTIEARSEPIPFTSATGTAKPNLAWDYTDDAGHYHWWVGDEADARVPTLTEVPDEEYWCSDCRDMHQESHLECLICGEHIEPGWFVEGPSPFTEYIKGPTEYTLQWPDGRTLSVPLPVVNALTAFFEGSGVEAARQYAQKVWAKAVVEGRASLYVEHRMEP